MLTVDEYGRIRRAHRDGMSIREIARRFQHSRRKVREVLEEAEPRPYTRTAAAPAPRLGAFQGIIEEILKADAEAPRKQRHTAARIHRRLVAEHGYAGCYAQVQRYVARLRRRERETFIPLDHAPGQRAECDFGQIEVDFPEGRRSVSVLLMTWAHSYAAYAVAVPTERTEAILHGMVQGFEFFECVPRELWWDNPTTVAVQILTGRERRINPRYLALASHYTFEPLFCMPARGNEKPHVENRVKWLKQEWSTPVPAMRDLAGLNEYLRERSLRDRQRVVTGQSHTIGRRFDEDRSAAQGLPKWQFDACLSREVKVDKYQTARFDNVLYSVPRPQAFQAVTVKAYVDRIEIVSSGSLIARHARCYEAGRQVLDPLHYLATLSRKPGCLDHAPLYRDWRLPASFTQLRQTLETQHGPHSGARQFIRVLQLLHEHSVERVSSVLDRFAAGAPISADMIIPRVRRLRDQEPVLETNGHAACLPVSVPLVQVPLPDLRRFNQFLSCGAPTDVEPSDAAEVQPQATASADDGRRV